MVYKEYDNAELYESSIPCPYTVYLLNDLVRNCGSVWCDGITRNIHDDKVTPHAELTGTATLMTANTGYVSYNRLLESAVVRNGDYIYMQKQDLACAQAKRLDIIEYQISTGTSTVIQVHSNTSTTYIIEPIHISYLYDRKILVSYDCYHGYLGVAPNRYNIHHVLSVDFATSSVTTELELIGNYEHAVGSDHHTDPYHIVTEQVITVEDKNGDIWGFAISMSYRDALNAGLWKVFGGCLIYYKNFTQGGVWNTAQLDPDIIPSNGGEECWVASEPVFISNNKFVIMYDCYPYSYSSYPPGCSGNIFFIFDINTQELTRSTFSVDAGVTYKRSEYLYPAYDKESGLIYYVTYSPNDDEYFCVNAYDVETDTWYDRVWAITDIDYDYELVIAQDGENAYFIYDYTGTPFIYRANGLNDAVLVGTFPNNFDGEFYLDEFTYELDVNGPSVWLLDPTTNPSVDLYQINVNGTEITSFINMSDISYHYNVNFVHLGDCIVIIMKTNLWAADYYLIT